MHRALFWTDTMKTHIGALGAPPVAAIEVTPKISAKYDGIPHPADVEQVK